MTTPPIYLIDASGFIYRAYYSRPPLQAPDGTPANAVVGFIEMMGHLMKYAAGARIGVVFDTNAPTWRHKRFAGYKTGRAERPRELTMQFVPIQRATDALSLPRLEQEGFEADDLIATYTRLALDNGHNVVIVSSDKDMMQLVDDKATVAMFDPLKKTMINEAAVVKKWGVPPKLLGDALALQGDTSDSIPGIPGIGQQTAAKLIMQFGSMEGVIEAAHDEGCGLTPFKRKSIMDNMAVVRLGRELIQLRDDSAMPVAFEALIEPKPQADKIHRFLDWLGMSDIPEPLRRFM